MLSVSFPSPERGREETIVRMLSRIFLSSTVFYQPILQHFQGKQTDSLGTLLPFNIPWVRLNTTLLTFEKLAALGPITRPWAGVRRTDHISWSCWVNPISRSSLHHTATGSLSPFSSPLIFRNGRATSAPTEPWFFACTPALPGCLDRRSCTCGIRGRPLVYVQCLWSKWTYTCTSGLLQNVKFVSARARKLCWICNAFCDFCAPFRKSLSFS